MTRPRLLLLAYSPLQRDARVLRQLALFKDDWDVTTVGYGPAPDGSVAHIRIPDEIIYWHKDRALLATRRFQRAYDTAPITRYLREHLPVGQHGAILANDIDTVPLAIGLRPTAGVHVDLHEYASRQNEHLPRWRLFVAPYVRYLVRRWVPQAASVTTVGPALAAEYRREFGIDVQVVTNAGPWVDLQPGTVPTPLRLVHSGIAVPERLEAMLEAMALVRSGATLDLFVVDVGDGYVEALRERYPAGANVRIQPPVPPEDLPRTLNNYDVGLCVLPPVTFNVEYSLPNKIFDFVQARLALVVGPGPEMAAVVRDHNLGVVTPDFEPSSIAATIDSLTPAEVARAKAGSDAAALPLSAEQQNTQWLRALNRLQH